MAAIGHGGYKVTVTRDEPITPDKPAGEASRRIVGYRNPAPCAAPSMVAGATDFSTWVPIYSDEARPPPPPTLDERTLAQELDALFGPITQCNCGDTLDWEDVVRALLTRLKDSGK